MKTIYQPCILCAPGGPTSDPSRFPTCPRCEGTRFVEAGQIQDPVDHDVLDVITKRLAIDGIASAVSRASDCVEFRDAATGQWYEIVVRPIDGPEEG